MTLRSIFLQDPACLHTVLPHRLRLGRDDFGLNRHVGAKVARVAYRHRPDLSFGICAARGVGLHTYDTRMVAALVVCADCHRFVRFGANGISVGQAALERLARLSSLWPTRVVHRHDHCGFGRQRRQCLVGVVAPDCGWFADHCVDQAGSASGPPAEILIE